MTLCIKSAPSLGLSWSSLVCDRMVILQTCCLAVVTAIAASHRPVERRLTVFEGPQYASKALLKSSVSYKTITPFWLVLVRVLGGTRGSKIK